MPKSDAPPQPTPSAGAASWNIAYFGFGFAQRDYNNRIKSYIVLDLYDFKPDKTYTKISMVLDNKWSASKNQPWKLEITKLDTVNKICAGTFSFVGVAADGSTVNITDGRFDMKYRKE